ncbi:MAG: MFS transporter, partial [Solimonas sp.]
FISMLLQQTPDSGRGFGISATVSGAIMFGVQLMALIGGPLAGRVADRQSARRALQGGALITALGWVGMAAGQGSLPVLIAMLCLQSVGSAMILASTPMVLADAVPLQRTSEANGVTAVLRQANLAIATQVSAFLLSLHSVTVGTAHYPAPASIDLTFAVLAAATVLGFLVSLTLPRRAQGLPTPALAI